MAVRANISRGYIWRPGLIGVAVSVFSVLFFYDGIVKYPLQQEQSITYNEILQQHPDPVEAGRFWEEKAKAEGWSIDKPTPRSDTDIWLQKLLGVITAPIGLYVLFGFFTSLGKWVEADEQGLRTRSGQEAKFSEITSLDKTRWQRKGIAVVHYESNGKVGKIVLDDWKFEREPTKRIYEAVEERMPGGSPFDAEPEPTPEDQGEDGKQDN